MIEQGDRIETTGEGRTQTWPGWLGTVTRVDEDGWIYAKMDGTSFSEEEFEPDEVRAPDPTPAQQEAILRWLDEDNAEDATEEEERDNRDPTDPTGDVAYLSRLSLADIQARLRSQLSGETR